MLETGPDDDDSSSKNRLLRLARLQRLYRLIRIFRVVKLVKMAKYNDEIVHILQKFDLKSSQTRILKLLVLSLFLVHLIACFFYLSAKMNDFSQNTWVY